MESRAVVLLGLASMFVLAGSWACSSGAGGGGTATGGATVVATGGVPGTGGVSPTGGSGFTGGTGGGPSTGGTMAGTGGALEGGAGGSTATGGLGGVAMTTGGSAGRGPSSGGAAGGAGPKGGGGGSGGASTAPDCASASGVLTYPGVPGAPKSPLYAVTANGVSQFVEKMTRFDKEMQVHYAYFGLAKGCTAKIAVTVSQSFSSFTLSPKSRKITATKSGNTLTFDTGPNYLILQIPSQELLFILIDDEETNPPQLGAANVKNLADYNVDNTGATLVTAKVQAAIDAASGAAQNILYVPPGKYKVGELSVKSNMTLYLAAGAVLDGSTNTADYAAAGPAVESTSHGLLHLNNVTNTNILGRGVVDAEGSIIRAGGNDTPSFKSNAVRVDKSSKVLIDGILVRDSVFWNTLVYTSDQVTIQNYKVINRRPTTTTYNQTDGVDFDASSNGMLSNAFVYSGDDSLSPKTEQEGNKDTSNITYQKAVLYSNSAACKIGTKTFGTMMTGILFQDIDIVKAGRAMVIDANDTALIQGTTYKDIRVEAVDSTLIDLEEDNAPDWRTAPNTSIAKDTYFTNVSSDVKKTINIHGKSSAVNINGVHFKSFTVQGKAVTSQTDADASWSINQYVSNVTFE